VPAGGAAVVRSYMLVGSMRCWELRRVVRVNCDTMGARVVWDGSRGNKVEER
jgi:hypothetical protein